MFLKSKDKKNKEKSDKKYKYKLINKLSQNNLVELHLNTTPKTEINDVVIVSMDSKNIDCSISKEYRKKIIVKHHLSEDVFKKTKYFKSKGKIGTLILRDINGIYKYPIEKIERKKGEKNQMILNIKGYCKKEQKRNNYRLNIYQPSSFLVNDYDKFNIEEKKDLSKINAMIEDISLTGVKLITFFKLFPNCEIYLDLSFAEEGEDKILEKVYGKVLRKNVIVKNQNKIKDDYFEYGISLELNDKQSKALNVWLQNKYRAFRDNGFL